MNFQKSEVVKVPYLDGLRGVAALMVLMAHLMIALYPAVVTYTPSQVHTKFDMALGLSPFSVLWQGNFAVCIFFVLSGFVLSDFCQHTKINFPAQIVRRYLRLAIPMLIVSTFAWVLLYFSAYNNYNAAVRVTQSGWLSMWYRFDPHFFKMVKEALYGAFVNGRADYNCNLWTMQIELMGSIYIFLLHALFKNRYIRFFVIIWFIKSNYNNYYLLFAWGALLFDFKDLFSSVLHKMLPHSFFRNTVVIFGFLLGAYFGCVPETQPGMNSIWHTWFTHNKHVQGWHYIGAMFIVLFLLEWKGMQQVLSSHAARFLGKISFVLYLIHIPIICSLTSWVVYATKAFPYFLTAIISAVITITFVITISALTYRYIDQYTTAFSRKVGNLVDQYFQSGYQPRFWFRTKLTKIQIEGV